jgi:hypothetical protein
MQLYIILFIPMCQKGKIIAKKDKFLQEINIRAPRCQIYNKKTTRSR